VERRVEVTMEILLASTILGPPNASVEERVTITSSTDARTKLSALSMSTVNHEPRLLRSPSSATPFARPSLYECATRDILEDKEAFVAPHTIHES
jgi:hypothetical protein